MFMSLEPQDNAVLKQDLDSIIGLGSLHCSILHGISYDGKCIKLSIKKKQQRFRTNLFRIKHKDTLQRNFGSKMTLD